MQWKLPQKSWLVQQFLRLFLGLGFPLAAFFAPQGGRGSKHAIARWVIAIIVFVYPQLKRTVASNLAQVWKLEPHHPRVVKGARRLLNTFGYSWCDMFRFGDLPLEKGMEITESITGFETIEELVEQGKGCILLTAHYGPWELGGILLRQKKVPVSVVYFPDQYPEAEEYRSRMRRGKDDLLEEIPLDFSNELGSLPILRAIQQGRFVAMQGDRDFNDKGWPTQLLGRRITLPPGPFITAWLTAVPVVPIFVAYTNNLGISIQAEAAITLDKTKNRDEEIQRAINQWAGILERKIQDDPTQWYTFYDYFDHGDEESS